MPDLVLMPLISAPRKLMKKESCISLFLGYKIRHFTVIYHILMCVFMEKQQREAPGLQEKNNRKRCHNLVSISAEVVL